MFPESKMNFSGYFTILSTYPVSMTEIFFKCGNFQVTEEGKSATVKTKKPPPPPPKSVKTKVEIKALLGSLLYLMLHCGR